MFKRTRYTVKYGSGHIAKFSQYVDALRFARDMKNSEMFDKTGIIAQFANGKLTEEFKHVALGE